MEQLRFIKTKYTYADFSTSVSPAYERALEERQAVGTVVLNVFVGGSFTIGVFEDPEKSMDLDYCRRKGIVVRRRLNPGGAIWGPEGGALLVFYLDTRFPWVPMKSVKEAFERTLSHLAGAVRDLFEIDARYRPLNDVEVEGRKLIATSARLEEDILTMRLLINVVYTDPDIIKDAIRTPVEKFQDKKIKDPGARFTCLETEVGRSVGTPDLEALARKTLEGLFGEKVSLLPGDLSGPEKRYAAEYQEKYTSDSWFYGNSERMRFKDVPQGVVMVEGRHKAPAGLIRVTLLVRGGSIHDLIITGDFHPSPYRVLKDMEEIVRGKPCRVEAVEEEIARIFDRPEVERAGTEVGDFSAAFYKAFRVLEPKTH